MGRAHWKFFKGKWAKSNRNEIRKRLIRDVDEKCLKKFRQEAVVAAPSAAASENQENHSEEELVVPRTLLRVPSATENESVDPNSGALECGSAVSDLNSQKDAGTAVKDSVGGVTKEDSGDVSLKALRRGAGIAQIFGRELAEAQRRRETCAMERAARAAARERQQREQAQRRIARAADTRAHRARTARGQPKTGAVIRALTERFLRRQGETTLRERHFC